MLSKDDLTNISYIISTSARATISSEIAHKWQILFWMISDLVQPFILATLWSAVTISGDLDYTSEQVISYYFISVVIYRITQDWSMNILSTSIASGDFSKYLMRPYSYIPEIIGVNFGLRAIRSLTLVPFIIVGYLIFGESLSYSNDPKLIILFLVAIPIGALINFILGNIVGSLTFYLKQISSTKAVFINISSILSGELIPYFVIPTSLFSYLQFQPFRYILSFPIEVISGSLTDDALKLGFSIAIIFLILLTLVFVIIYKNGLKRYDAEGI